MRGWRRRASGLAVGLAVLGGVIPACSGDERFPQAERGKVIELFDAAEIEIDFIPEREYLSALAVAADGTVHLGVAPKQERLEDGKLFQNFDKGRLVTLPRSGKPTIDSGGTTTALALSADGTLYQAVTGSRRETLRFVRGDIDGAILEYGTPLALGGVPNPPGLNRTLVGIAVDERSGDLYLADAHKIDRIDRLGRATTVTGSRRGEAEPKPPDNPDAGLAGYQFNSIAGIGYQPSSGALWIADGQLYTVRPLKPASGRMVSARFGEKPEDVEGGFGRRGVAVDPKTGTVYGISQDDQRIIVNGDEDESDNKAPKRMLETVARLTMGADGNLYLWGSRKVHVLGLPAEGG